MMPVKAAFLGISQDREPVSHSDLNHVRISNSLPADDDNNYPLWKEQKSRLNYYIRHGCVYIHGFRIRAFLPSRIFVIITRRRW